MDWYTQILREYTDGSKNIDETNKALKDGGFPLLDPDRNKITEGDKHRTTVGYYPWQANGYGLLDTGTGSLDKVAVVAGILSTCDCGNMTAYCYICGRTYGVYGKELVELERDDG